jgi:hypothetical protein
MKLTRIHKSGVVYIPAEIRRQFKGCMFYIYVEGGKIVLDPVRIE